jgi:hypothetical protein
MEYFFRCNGNFIIHMKKILHEIDSIWKNYYIIKFPWNKYYAGTNISSHKEGGIRGLGFQVKIV